MVDVVLGAGQFEGVAAEQLFVGEHPQRSRNACSRVVRHDDVINVAPRARYKRVGKLCLVFCGSRCNFLGIANIGAENNLHSALGTHHCNFSAWPRIIHVAPQMLRGHNVIGAAIGFTSDYRDFGNGALGVSV